MSPFTAFVVADAALARLEAPDCAVLHGPVIAALEPRAASHFKDTR